MGTLDPSSPDYPEPVIAGAEIVAGHDGEAELLVRVRHPNGAESPVTLDAEAGYALLRRCGADDLDGVRGQSWRMLMPS